MEHLAILAKKRKLLSKIISGEKTIESRWYKFKKTPYQNISQNDIIYFKESGDLINIKAKVSKVLFFDRLDEEKIKDILKKYGDQIGVSMSYSKELIGKKFCTLVFIDDVQSVEPFNINKEGYGLMAAWITLNKIDSIKK
jgi:ASC-1-like (ASCH) protein